MSHHHICCVKVIIFFITERPRTELTKPLNTEYPCMEECLLATGKTPQQCREMCNPTGKLILKGIIHTHILISFLCYLN